MEQVRKFALKNANGDIVSLNDLDVFGYQPDGLGVSIANEYYGASANFILSSTALNQSVFSLQLIFGGVSQKSYKQYHDFVQFMNFQPVTFIYSVDGVGSFNRDSRLRELPKSEINEWNVLETTLELEFYTPWYQWVTGSYGEYEDQEGDGKIYANIDLENNQGFYTYEYIYAEDSSEKTGAFLLSNESLYMGLGNGSPLEMTIYGGDEGVTDPAWSLFDGSTLLQNDRYFLTIPPNYKLVVSSVPQDQFVRLISPDGLVSNVYQSQDMTKSNFITVPVGEYTLQVEVGGAEVSYRMRQEWVVV